jgi:DeoR family fructose operon transcriptional repressor
MIAQERFQSIGELLASRQKMTVHELQAALGVSPATLRRDLAEMEEAGKVIRVRGAVVHPTYFRGEPSLAQKSRDNATAKRAIAKIAAEMVPLQSTVFVDSGTTCLEVGRLLLARRDLTIVTNSIPLCSRVHEGEDAAKMIVIGGEVRPISGAMVGALALSWLEKLRADWCFVGASGLCINEGASTTELGEAAVKQAFLGRSKNKVLLADGRKWQQPATVNFAGWSEFDYWITDGEADQAALPVLEKQGVRVLYAETK